MISTLPNQLCLINAVQQIKSSRLFRSKQTRTYIRKYAYNDLMKYKHSNVMAKSNHHANDHMGSTHCMSSINIKPAMVSFKIKPTTTKHDRISSQLDAKSRLFRNKKTRVYIRKYAYKDLLNRQHTNAIPNMIYYSNYHMGTSFCATAKQFRYKLSTRKHPRNRGKHKICVYWSEKQFFFSNRLNLIKAGAQDSHGLDSSIH